MLGKFHLEIELGNAAMSDSHDIARALKNLVEDVQFATEDEDYGASIRDANGNVVGSWHIEVDEPTANVVEAENDAREEYEG